MLQLALLRSSCTEKSPETWPCSFKQLWFYDMYLLLPNIDNDYLALVDGCHGAARSATRLRIIETIWSTICLRIALRTNDIQAKLVHASTFLTSTAGTTKRVKRYAASSATRRQVRPNLTNIPTELRLKIFDYATRGLQIRVVGYRQDAQDAFYFKERGQCAIATTCRQFYQEALEVYFQNLSIHFKAAYPSEFSGDMTAFGASRFRDRVRRIKIADPDEHRRLKISTAFKNANVEFSDKQAAGARKCAYYFH